MGFMIAALSNRNFLCGAIVVTAAVSMLWDLPEVAEGAFIWHPMDFSHLLLVLLVARYLQRVEADDQTRGLIKGFLFVLVLMLSITYVFI